MLHRILAVAMLAAVLGCTDRAPVTEPDGGVQAAASLATLSKRPEALAKIVAKGLRNAAFRAYLKAQLDASPYREHKLQFETFLAANEGRAFREIAGENGTTKEALATDFSRVPARVVECIEDCGGGGGTIGDVTPPPPPAPGLYMTKSHFVQDFEGWLKGSPEFEVHILGQKGASDSLYDYQC